MHAYLFSLWASGVSNRLHQHVLARSLASAPASMPDVQRTESGVPAAAPRGFRELLRRWNALPGETGAKN